MKKILAVVLCLLVLLPCCVPFASAKKKAEDEVEFTLNLSERYTDILEVSEGDIHASVDKSDENTESKRIVYIALLSSALVVSIVILVVTLKRVPDEENIDISGTGKKKKTENAEE
jgi:hypothetical protein